MRSPRRIFLPVALYFSFALAYADPIKVPFNLRDTSVTILETLEKRSFAQKDDEGWIVNDEISSRGFDLLIKGLDRYKTVFLQEDIDRLSAKWKNELDEELKDGQVAAAQEIMEIYYQRMDELSDLAQELIPVAPDFSLTESVELDHELRSYVNSQEERREALRKIIKYRRLVLGKLGQSEEEIVKTLSGLYSKPKESVRMKSLEPHNLYKVYVSHLLAGLDPHSTYMTPQEADSFAVSLGGTMFGIGAVLNEKEGGLEIQKLMEGGPAEMSGQLQAKDLIIGVAEGEKGAFVDTTGLPLRDAIQLILGAEGSKVRLKVVSPGSPDVKEITLERGAIKLQEILAKGRVIEVKSPSTDRMVKVGLLTIPAFYRDIDKNVGVADDVKRILGELDSQGAEVVILDQRDNGGGFLTDALDIVSMFIDSGPLFQFKSADGSVNGFADTDGVQSWTKPVVVLNNKNSASASEIVAGALENYKRALIVGDESTHGKGSVQSTYSLSERGSELFLLGAQGTLKATVQQFYLPSGQSTQKTGVRSNVVLPTMASVTNPGESGLPYHLPESVIPEAPNLVPFTKYWQDGLDAKLQKASEERRKSQPELKALLESLEQAKQAENEKTIPLNQQEFDNSLTAKTLKLQEEEESEEEPDTDKIDAYTEEVLKITVDYLEALGL